MPDSGVDVQAAVIGLLRADASVAALVGNRIYDRAPQHPTYPFIELGAVSAQPDFGTHSGEGWDEIMQIHAWSRSAAGRVEAKLIRQAIVQALHDAKPALDGLIAMRVVGAVLREERDHETTQAIIRLRVMTHP